MALSAAPALARDRFRQARERAGLSQDALAQQAGVHRMTIARIEWGRSDPDTSTIWNVARVLGVPAAWLAGFVAEDVVVAVS